MKQYTNLIYKILTHGQRINDRTGTGTLSIFGHMMEFDLQKGFPLLTLRKLHFKSIVHELIWFLRGETNVKYLQDHKVSIWDEWAGVNGELGKVYGYQWRSFGGKVDQLWNAIEELRTNKHSRRILVSAWNPTELHEQALPPCHVMFQFYVRGGFLDLMLTQRSADVFLGVPFNIASYALLVHIVAKLTGLKPGKFIHSIGDTHLYLNHIDQTRQLIERSERELPSIELSDYFTESCGQDFANGILEVDFTLRNYNPHPAIRAEVSV